MAMTDKEVDLLRWLLDFRTTLKNEGREKEALQIIKTINLIRKLGRRNELLMQAMDAMKAAQDALAKLEFLKRHRGTKQ